MRRFLNFTAAMLSLMLLTACQSPQIVTVEKTIVPEISFPIFPLAENMTDNKDGTVTVPSEWVILFEEYHIRINSTEDYYNGLKEIYENFYGK